MLDEPGRDPASPPVSPTVFHSGPDGAVADTSAAPTTPDAWAGLDDRLLHGPRAAVVLPLLVLMGVLAWWLTR